MRQPRRQSSKIDERVNTLNLEDDSFRVIKNEKRNKPESSESQLDIKKYLWALDRCSKKKEEPLQELLRHEAKGE